MSFYQLRTVLDYQPVLNKLLLNIVYKGRKISNVGPNSPDIENWLRLIRADGVGPTTFAKLLKRFRSVDRALGASVSELEKINGIGPKIAGRIARSRDKFDTQALSTGLEANLRPAAGPVYQRHIGPSRQPRHCDCRLPQTQYLRRRAGLTPRPHVGLCRFHDSQRHGTRH